MKLSIKTVPLLLLLAPAANGASVEGLHRHHGRHGSRSGALFAGAEFGRAKVTPEDIQLCSSYAEMFIQGSVSPKEAIEKAMDFCATDKKIGDKNYVCPHFKEAISAALRDVPSDAEISATKFCKITEEHMLEMRGAARVPNIGSGPMTNFKLSDHCSKAVTSAVAPEKEVTATAVPDFWYAMCFNQDCAHFLPSRTRWCTIDRAPTHSAKVCNAVRDFANDEANVKKGAMMTPDDVCDVYSDFVTEMGIDIEAYEAVMQGDSVKRIPVPSDSVRALLSSQLKNEAGARHLRDNEGTAVEPLHSSAFKAGALLAFVLPFMALA